MTIDLETRLKRLRYRTSHTGTKETDILLGSFVEKYSDPDDEPVMKKPFTYQAETTDNLTTEQLKILIYEESQKISQC